MTEEKIATGSLGFKIGQLRMEEGYSFKEYGQIVGLSPQQVSAMERGKMKSYRLDALVRIARFHGVSLDMLSDEEKPIPSRWDRTLERLRSMPDKSLHYIYDSQGERQSLEAAGITRDAMRDWKHHYRRGRFREKGLVII